MSRERGSALMLVPAGILILILLAAISADSALAYMGQRELQNEAAAAANNAATQAVTNLQAGDSATPDGARVNQIVGRAVMHQYSGGVQATAYETAVNGTTVTVTLHGRVHYIFSGAIPGAQRFANINVQSAAQLQFG